MHSLLTPPDRIFSHRYTFITCDMGLELARSYPRYLLRCWWSESQMFELFNADRRFSTAGLRCMYPQTAFIYIGTLYCMCFFMWRYVTMSNSYTIPGLTINSQPVINAEQCSHGVQWKTRNPVAPYTNADHLALVRSIA